MKPYDKIQPRCVYGEYDMSRGAAYTITDAKNIKGPWYYIYQNRKILLYVDQNGPVKIQYQPPSGILVAKRELGEKQSKLITWIQSDDVNSGIPFSNFNLPNLQLTAKPPKYTVNWNPSFATYTVSYPELDVITTVLVPHDKATVCVKTKIVNKTEHNMSVNVTPSLYPYINKPQMVAWDLPEWYLTTSTHTNGRALTIAGKMRDPDMNKANERSVTYNVDFEENAEFELSMSAYTGTGSFFSPDSVTENTPLSYRMKDAENVPPFAKFPAVFAAKYKTELKSGESKTYTQVLTVQEDTSYNAKENEYDECYFTDDGYNEKLSETDAFYNELFSKRTVKTENPYYDNFVNTFAPLQMYWVGSLDRGWPSSMRGSRDASQDFTGMVSLYPEWARAVILNLFLHQRRDGWMPRQISTISREAPHDLRYFVDGGAFFLELINEYLTFTRDLSLIEEKVKWYDSEEDSSVLEHIFTTIGYYLDEKNIGEHGLCKAWYGDWWDVMDKIGMEGRGETVTVTAQNILNLKNLVDMLDWLASQNKKYEKYLAKKEQFQLARERFIDAMKTHAFNKNGFFNGYFNDNGKWLLSDCDPDGCERVYLVSNAWALISGFADEKMQSSVIDNILKKNACDMGYETVSTPFYDYIDKAGRVGLGDGGKVNLYNHAQSFMVRAMCTVGRADLAYEMTRHILPLEEEYAPVELTCASPFTLANKYNNSEATKHRVELQYLSGTVSYFLRTVYNFFFGIKYGYGGLTIKPCLPRQFGKCSVEFTYIGKKFTIEFVPTDKNPKITVNSEVHEGKELLIPDSIMKSENKITVEY